MDTESVYSHACKYQPHAAHHGKPRGLVKMGLENKIEGSAFIIPDPVIIGRDDPEAISTGRNIGVISGAAGPGGGPMFFETFQPEFAVHVVGGRKAPRGKLGFKFAASSGACDAT